MYLTKKESEIFINLMARIFTFQDAPNYDDFCKELQYENNNPNALENYKIDKAIAKAYQMDNNPLTEAEIETLKTKCFYER